MRTKNTGRILAIDPGTRNLGFALLEGAELVHFGVKIIRKMKSPHEKLKEGKRTVLRLIEDFQPQSLVVEKTFFANNRNSELLNVFSDEIRLLGRRNGLHVMSLAANTVRKIICGNGAASKDDVARTIVSRYHELKPYLTSDRKWKQKFYRNVFDAVALGLAGSVLGD